MVWLAATFRYRLMSQPEASAADQPLAEALKTIARGRVDCGRPIAAAYAREIARRALIEAGHSWNKPKTELER